MSRDKKWFIPNDEAMVPHGPFSTTEILAKIQAGDLKLDDFIWLENGNDDWLRLFEVEEFKHSFKAKPVYKMPVSIADRMPDSIVDSVATNSAEQSSLTDKNRFPRVPFEAKIIIHNQKQAYFFSAIDISEKGISIKVDRELLFKPADEVIITIRNFLELGTFSVRAVVLQQFKVHGQDVLSLYFMQLNPKIRRHIAQYVLIQLKQLNPDQQVI